MESLDFIAIVHDEGERFAEAAAPALDSLVPDCAGWTVEAMVGHLGQIHRWATHLVSTRAQAFDAAGLDIAPPQGRAVIEWFRAGHADLVAALHAIGPDEAVWSWSDRHDGGFYHRRMAHETALHRWDAERALAPPTPIAADLATDGIDEILTVGMRSSTSRADRTYPTGSLHLHRTDGPGEWMLTPAADGSSYEITHEHGKGDAAVRGAASDLLVYLWGRGGGEGLEVFGDDALVAAWGSLAP